jgi:hypothetical protein
MKTSLLWLFPVLLATPALAQRTEFSGQVHLGLFRFAGTGTQRATTINKDFSEPASPAAYAPNPYGSSWGAGVGASVRAQHVGARGLLAALDLGYDYSRSRAAVTRFDVTPPGYVGPAALTEAATGMAHLRVPQLAGFAGFGQRLSYGDVQLDALAGPELAVLLAARETGDGTHGGTYNPVSTAWTLDTPYTLAHQLDWRLRADVTAWYHRLGLTASYAWGLTNLQNALADVPDYETNGAVHSRTLRFGMAYRLQ